MGHDTHIDVTLWTQRRSKYFGNDAINARRSGDGNTKIKM